MSIANIPQTTDFALTRFAGLEFSDTLDRTELAEQLLQALDALLTNENRHFEDVHLLRLGQVIKNEFDEDERLADLAIDLRFKHQIKKLHSRSEIKEQYKAKTTQSGSNGIGDFITLLRWFGVEVSAAQCKILSIDADADEEDADEEDEQLPHEKALGEVTAKVRAARRENVYSQQCIEVLDEARASTDKVAEHPYFKDTGINLFKEVFRLKKGLQDKLIVPRVRVTESSKTLDNPELEVVGWQEVTTASKKFNLGNKVAGSFSVIGEFESKAPVIICEGFKTGLAIHQATGYFVLVAGSCSNLKTVAVLEALHRCFFDSQMLIAGDVGEEEKAKEAAELGWHSCGGGQFSWNTWYGSVFPDSEKKGYDFADLLKDQGEEAVKSAIDDALANQSGIPEQVCKNRRNSIKEAATDDWKVSWKQHTDSFNQKFASVMLGGKHRVVEDNGKEHIFYERRDLSLLYDNTRIKIGQGARGGATYENHLLAWAKHPDCRTYHKGIEFNATGNPSQDKYNLWTGFSVKPVKGDCGLVYKHIREVICSGCQETNEYFLNAFAFMIQNPDKVLGVALVVRGEKGTGKGILGHFIINLFGRHGFYINNPSHLTGKFNAHLSNVAFLFADEAFFSGDVKAENVS